MNQQLVVFMMSSVKDCRHYSQYLYAIHSVIGSYFCATALFISKNCIRHCSDTYQSILVFISYRVQLLEMSPLCLHCSWRYLYRPVGACMSGQQDILKSTRQIFTKLTALMHCGPEMNFGVKRSKFKVRVE